MLFALGFLFLFAIGGVTGIMLAVIAADDAFKDAGIQSKAYTETPAIDGKRFGCNIGAGLISAELNELTTPMHTARDGNRLI